MPVALELVADFGAVIVSILAIALAAGIYLICNGIGSAIGKIGIGPATVNVGGWFTGIGDKVASWIVDQTKSMWVHLATLFFASVWILDHTFNAAVTAVEHAFDYADHLATVTIPNAIDTAVGRSRTIVNNTVTDIANEIRHGDNEVGTAVAAVVATAAATVHKFAEHELSVAESYADDRLKDAKTYADAAVQTLASAVGKQLTTLTTTVGNDFTDAKTDAQNDATAALNTAKGLISDATTAIEKVAQADADTVSDTLTKAINAVKGTVSDLTTTVGSDLTTAETYARGQVADGLNDVVDVLNGTATVVGGAIAAAATGVATGIQSVVTDAQNDASAALSSANQALGQALAGVTSDISNQAIAFNGDIGSMEGLLAGAITGAIGAVVARVAKIEECYVGNCADSQFPFSTLLKDALGLAEVAGAGLFLEKLVDDPAGAEQEYAGAIGELGNAVTDTGSDIWKAFDTLLSI